MRYSPQHKIETRQKLLHAAAEAIRIDGPRQVGVAGVMAKSGLTHGGFYAHFASKEALVEEAMGEMFGQGRARLHRAVEDKTPAEGLWAYIRFYLSPAHRDARGQGCPVPALLSDMPRVAQSTRGIFSEGAGRLRSQLAELLKGCGHKNASAAADSLLAEMVGALMLARAEPDPERSNEILARSRQALKERFHLGTAAA